MVAHAIHLGKTPVGVSGDYTSNLVAHWPMDNANVSGTTINELVSGNNGTASGGVSSVSGPSSTTARGFDGTGIITFGTRPHNWNTGSFSVAAWVYFNDADLGAAVGSQTIFVDDRVGDGSNYFRMFLEPGGGATHGWICGTLTGSTGIGADDPNNIPDATWKHVVYCNTGGGVGGTMKMYVDGVLAATFADGRSSGQSAVFGSIGGVTLTGTIGLLEGRIRGLRVYSGRALADADAAALFASNS